MSTRAISLLLAFLLIFLSLLSLSCTESSRCLMVYKEGGAPAVFQSPKCPRWNLFPDDDRRARPIYNCQVALHQGRRRSQEDRAVCAVDVRIPFIGINGLKDINVAIIAVFDGHNGMEASEMASKLLLEYLFLHVHFLLDGFYSATLSRPIEPLAYTDALDMIYQAPSSDMEGYHFDFNLQRYRWILPRIFDSNLHLEILKESLLRTIHDIDATFSKEAVVKNLHSGSTATVVLIADGQILAVNVGDSKAILCSESFHSPHESKGSKIRLKRKRNHKYVDYHTQNYETFGTLTSYEEKYIHVKELTEDHHPDRHDERNRVEAAGGYVEWFGVPRVNGELAVSRAIGDVFFKSYGVISTPEVLDWQPLMSNDSYLIVATDGVFDKLTTQDTCDLLWHANIKNNVNSEFAYSATQSLADYIVKTAFERGTVDNLAAVVVPLRLPEISASLSKESHLVEARKAFLDPSTGNFGYNISDNGNNSSSLISVEYFNQLTKNFNRLVVGIHSKKLGCFYLSENLNERKDYDLLEQKDGEISTDTLSSDDISEVLRCNNDGDKRLCVDYTFYSLFGLDNLIKDQGSYPGNFTKFLGLLDSFASTGSGINYTNPPEYKVPDFRYTLERQFGGGSYGEVWLAFQWNCSEGCANTSCRKKSSTCFVRDGQFGLSGCNMYLNKNSSRVCPCSLEDDNSYILKRIKVEKGNIAYRSGLREQYFGEMFLKAIMLQELFVSKSSTDLECSSSYELEVDKNVPIQKSYVYPSHSVCTTTGEEGLNHIGRYVEYFESPLEGIWLVFHNEGLSLKKLLYTEVWKGVKHSKSYENVVENPIFHPSSWWRWLRTTEKGRREMQSLIYQLLLALKSCHVRDITHRDIKPENMIICFEDATTGRCLRRIPTDANYHPRLRLIDFGSALDKFTLEHLYGSGPTRSEQTFAYAPPEALLNASWFQAPAYVTKKYDIWSVGVFIMELILGSPNIFESNSRARALIYQRLQGWSEDIQELAYKLDSYVDMCVLIPGVFPRYPGRDHDKLKCSEESFADRIKRRDPLKLGFPNIWALRLVRQLLVWQPEDRLNIDNAIQHPYFRMLLDIGSITNLFCTRLVEDRLSVDDALQHPYFQYSS